MPDEHRAWWKRNGGPDEPTDEQCDRVAAIIERAEHEVLSVPCPVCRVLPGKPCKPFHGLPTMHAERIHDAHERYRHA